MTRSTPTSPTYEEDFFTWTRDQADALRRLSDKGELDVVHLAEEIEDLGKRDLREVISLLGLLSGHLMKIAANPDNASVPHWRIEARAFRRSARKAFTPGMRRSIDLAALWQEAADDFATDRVDMALLQPPRQPCPFALDELLADGFDIDRALEKIGR